MALRILDVLLLNALTATALALIVSLAARRVSRPALVHLLWLLVLLKLLAPPVVQLSLLPTIDEATFSTGSVPVAAAILPSNEAERAAVSETGVAARGGAAPVAAQPLQSAAGGPRWLNLASMTRLLVAVWIAGALLAVTLIGVRVVEFRRRLHGAGEAPAGLARRVVLLAAAVGGVAPPRVRLVSGRISPMIWGRTLLWPEGLSERLDAAETDALMTHELGHLRRRDHWVRLFELAAVIVFWWHPVMWWARRNVRRAEESACDALVLETLPGRSRAYATGLVKTLEFLAVRSVGTPGLATGAMGSRELKQRLIMILDSDRRRSPAGWQRLAVGGLAVAALLLSPTWADRGAAQEKAVRAEILGLEREIHELEMQLEQLHVRRAELKQSFEREHFEDERLAVESEVERLEREGLTEEAELLRREWDLRDRHMALERQEFQLQRQSLDVQRELRKRLLDIEAAQLAGDEARAEELAEQARALELEMKRMQSHSLRDRKMAQFQLELERLAAQVDTLRRAGRNDEADELESELAKKRRKLKEVHEQREGQLR